MTYAILFGALLIATVWLYVMYRVVHQHSTPERLRDIEPGDDDWGA